MTAVLSQKRIGDTCACHTDALLLCLSMRPLHAGIAYDPEWNEQYWMSRPTTVFGRIVRIGLAAAQWQLYKRSHGEAAAAEYLKTVLVDLGPAFVKIGQAVSSRPDVVPPLYLKQLESLQVCVLLRQPKCRALLHECACHLDCAQGILRL